MPGTGTRAAYVDAAELHRAMGPLMWAWFILSVIFSVAAMRASWSLLLALVFFDLELMLLAVAVGNVWIPLASRGVGFMVAFFAR